jgi:hypothetical protein
MQIRIWAMKAWCLVVHSLVSMGNQGSHVHENYAIHKVELDKCNLKDTGEPKVGTMKYENMSLWSSDPFDVAFDMT